MKVKEMGKQKNRRPDERLITAAVDVRVDEIETTITETPTESTVMTGTEIDGAIDVPKPRVSSFVPRPCSMCTALRPPGTNYTRVETTRGNVRYCRCGFCNNTFKQSE